MSLLRAHALARELRAELHVLMEVKPREPFAPNVPPSVTRANVTRWISELLGDDAARGVQLRSGLFLDDVAATARELRVQLIVLVPDGSRVGRSVAKLVRSAAVPVLVAREPATRSPTIVAATDLVDPSYPVLREAATFGGLLNAPVLAVHNISPLRSIGRASSSSRAHELDRRTRALDLAAQSGVIGSDSAAMVDTRMSTAGVILRTAESSSANLIVIGARTKRRFGRIFGSSLAARLVNRAVCSVLVTPVLGLAPP